MSESEAVNVGSVDEFPEGEAVVIDAEDAGTEEDVMIVHAEDGNFYALDDMCTHEEAALSDGWVEGTEIECPLHAARFCLKTGEALCLPATVAARTHRVEVVDGEVLLHPSA